MDGIFSINNRKSNHFSFDLEIEGLDVNDVKPRFVIKYRPDYCLTFNCFHEDGDRWNVQIPELPFLERTTYNFVIEVIVDGYFFEGAKGTLNVVGTPEVYVRDVTTEKSTERVVNKEKSDIFKQPERVDYLRGREKPIAQVAEETAQKSATIEEQSTDTPTVEKPSSVDAKQSPLAENSESVKPTNTDNKLSLIKQASQSTRNGAPKKVIRRAKPVGSTKRIIEDLDNESTAKKAKVIVKKGKQVVI